MVKWRGNRGRWPFPAADCDCPSGLVPKAWKIWDVREDELAEKLNLMTLQGWNTFAIMPRITNPKTGHVLYYRVVVYK